MQSAGYPSCNPRRIRAAGSDPYRASKCFGNVVQVSPRSQIDQAAARARGLLARREMGAVSRSSASRKISSTLLELPELTPADTVAGYWPTEDEVDLVSLWKHLRTTGVSVLLPRIDPTGRSSMHFVHWHPEIEMVANRFGIPEPIGGATPPEEIDVVVLPCTAVDDAGTRVGMGSGFYDRALQSCNDPDHSMVKSPPVLIAAAFDSQRVTPQERLLRGRWDVPVDVIVTESVTIRPGRRTTFGFGNA